MESVMQSDIFFFISSIGFILLFAGAAFVLIYAIRIIRDIKEIADKIRSESDAVISDVRSAREAIKAQKGKILALLGSWFIFKEAKKRGRKKGGE